MEIAWAAIQGAFRRSVEVQMLKCVRCAVRVNTAHEGQMLVNFACLGVLIVTSIQDQYAAHAPQACTQAVVKQAATHAPQARLMLMQILQLLARNVILDRSGFLLQLPTPARAHIALLDRLTLIWTASHHALLASAARIVRALVWCAKSAPG